MGRSIVNAVYFLAVQFGVILIMGFATMLQNRKDN